MNIKIKNCLSGAQEAEGVTIVMDVFRASNSIIACFASGAECVFPVEELEEAHELKKKYPDYLAFGERKGLMPEGFDHGNAPASIAQMNLKDKKIILTTSAGTKGILYSKNATEILIGSFANAQIIVDYLKKKKPEKVTLLAIGESAMNPATEDEECAKYIKSKLEGPKPDFEKIKEEILKSDGAKRLKRLNQNDDLEFCLRLNVCHMIPKFNRQNKKISL